MKWHDEIAAVLGWIFVDHPRASLVGKVRCMRWLMHDVAILRDRHDGTARGRSALSSTRPKSYGDDHAQWDGQTSAFVASRTARQVGDTSVCP